MYEYKQACICLTCFEEVKDGVFSDARHFAGAEEHAELIHVKGYRSCFMNSQPLSDQYQQIQTNIHITYMMQTKTRHSQSEIYRD